MRHFALLFLFSVILGCASAFGLVGVSVSTLFLRGDTSRMTSVLSFLFVAAAIGVAGALLPAFVSVASNPSQRGAYYSSWQPWLFLAGISLPHLLWFAVFRRPFRAALVAVVAICAAATEFLAIISAA